MFYLGIITKNFRAYFIKCKKIKENERKNVKININEPLLRISLKYIINCAIITIKK